MVRKAGFALFLIVVVAVAAILLLTRIDRMIVNAVEAHGSAITGTDVRLRRANVSLRERIGTLSGLTIDNPPGFESSHALYMDEIRLDIDLASVGRDVLVVNEVIVNGAHLNAEQRGRAINLVEIQRHIAQAAETAPPPDEEARIIIDRFVLTNATVTLISEALEERTSLDLSDVTVQGIGRATGGATYEEATHAMLGPILTAARSAAERRLGEALRREIEEEARERLRDLLDRL